MQINHPMMGWKLSPSREGDRNHPMRAMEVAPTGGKHHPLRRAQLPMLARTPSLEPAGSNRRKPKLATNPTKLGQPDHELTNAEWCMLLIITPAFVPALCSAETLVKTPKS